MTKDQKLIDAITNTPNVVIGAVGERAARVKSEELEYQKAFISRTNKQAGYINLRHDNDNIVRRTSPAAATTDYPNSIDLLLARIGSGVDYNHSHFFILAFDTIRQKHPSPICRPMLKRQKVIRDRYEKQHCKRHATKPGDDKRKHRQAIWLCYIGGAAACRWLHRHDGVPPGGSQGRTLAAFG